ncbi:PKD domain-containing protein [Mariniphaga anaerophila]|uniref:PKD domain-containing protein n=1 Tax=Mariniphaga anaerophila TaxID=1484053 RepID=A0A1M4ZW49_9BACT|nr:PKD domain-containing protein [Mariniphaga anaerophila]SHF22259.1 PKD domain-containing protein [Mariniphaga anaerophila]
MKKSLFYLVSGFLFIMVILFPSCSEDETRPVFPLSAEIFNSVVGKQVAFTALTHSAVSWEWNFGDGNTSTEQNPVHVYEEGGYYIATLTAKDNAGNTASSEVNLAISLPPYALLTGNHTADGYTGKTWKLTSSHNGAGDYLANADANLSVVSGTPKPLPDGIFSTQFKMGDIYEDEFTFYYDGSYQHDVKEDGASFGGLVFEIASTGGAGIVNMNGKDYGLCIAKYTPESNATFTFAEDENLTVSSVYGAGGQLTFNNVMTIDFPNSTEFVGFRDFQRKVIVNKITNTQMQLVMFMAAGDGETAPVGINTHALVLSFDAIN